MTYDDILSGTQQELRRGTVVLACLLMLRDPGYGYALLEELRVRDGVIQTPNFTTYLLPTALDVPEEIVPVVMELADPHGPFGARGVAEMPLVPFLPAVAIAIHDATGVWLTDQPFTAERVLAALGGMASD